MKYLICLLLSLIIFTNAYTQNFDIYVSDAGNFNFPPWQILKFDHNGENPEVFISENLSWPQDIVFLEDDNTVLVSNLNSGRINRHDAETGEFLGTFATGIEGPTRMKIGPDNLLYVLQWSGNGRVKRYELDGTFVDDFTSVGVSRSIGLDWDDAGNLYVASFNQALVRKFDDQGNDLGVFVDSNLQGPTNIRFDDNGNLLVTDWKGGAIRQFDADGNFSGNFVTGLSQPEGVAVLPDGDFLIGNGGTGAVKRFEADGDFVDDFVAPGSGGLIQPNAVIVRNLEAPSNFQINAGLNDVWYEPETAGQGFFIIFFPIIEQMFVGWFTYDLTRPVDGTAMLGEPGHRWLTAQGPVEGNSANLTLFLSQGGVFNAAQPAAVTDPTGIGTMTIEFAGCNEALVGYEIDDPALAGQIPIQRITTDNVALCQSLQ